MILLNETPILLKKFPDNTLATKVGQSLVLARNVIEWRYESDDEMILVYYLTKHLREHGSRRVILNMPYIPNGRMDRVKNDEDVFTLKYFAEFINSLKFDKVMVRDPHSSVSAALFDNIEIEGAEDYIIKTISKINSDNFVLYFPDEGAMKRYSEHFAIPYAFGVKQRDWCTGDIQGITLMHKDVVKGKDVLIIDDICSRGGTFYHSAKALKAAGAEDIYLYITHCENTIFKGELVDSDLINHIYTTPSIFTLAHEKITVIK